MKKIKFLFYTVVLLLLFLLIVHVFKTYKSIESETEQLTPETPVIYSEPKTVIDEDLTYDPFNDSVKNMEHEMERIENIGDRKDWFIEYKKIIRKYQNIIDPPETIYDYYSEEEIEILHRIVESECTGLDFNKKVNVANVIFNRINNEKFPNTIEGVIFQKNPIQFSPIADGRYYSVKLENETLLAIEYAFMFPDTTDGALFFEAIWSEELNYEEVMCDGSHKFYK